MTGVEGFSERFLVTAASVVARERFGLDIAVLRAHLVEYDDSQEDSGDAYLFTENLRPISPRLGEWCGQEALVERVIADARDGAAIRRWFLEGRQGQPAHLPPWQKEGWFADAVSWIQSALPGAPRVEEHITWSGSSLLRVGTDVGRYYFKAAPDFFHQEAAVTAMIAERFPGVVPRPVAINQERGWMLTGDFGDEFVRGMGIEHWEGALDALLAIHRGSVGHVGSLLRAGCVDRRPPVLQAQIEDLAEGRRGPLPDGSTDRLRAAIPRFRDLCADLAGSPIPSTLVHGDFHAGNVAVRGSRYLIFDWTDACIAHPFVDLATFFHSFGPPSTDAVVRDRLRDRYLRGWGDLMPHDEAVDLFQRTEPVAAMHHAISYQAVIAALDPDQRWEWLSHLPWWLTKALGSR